MSPGSDMSKFLTTSPSLLMRTLCGMYFMPYSGPGRPVQAVALPSSFFSIANLSPACSDSMLQSKKFTLPLYFSSAANLSICWAAGPHAGQKFW